MTDKEHSITVGHFAYFLSHMGISVYCVHIEKGNHLCGFGCFGGLD